MGAVWAENWGGGGRGGLGLGDLGAGQRGCGFGPDPSLAHFMNTYESYCPFTQEQGMYTSVHLSKEDIPGSPVDA